jgi:pimeloyl-ACP methyl ester carboxylesterase
MTKLNTYMKSLLIIIIIISLWAQPAYPISYLTDGTRQADKVARDAGFNKQRINTSDFILTSYTKLDNQPNVLRIYIEGDGFAFSSRRRLSSNPTPKDPVALKLAVKDPYTNIAYLARPCQYISKKEEKNHKEKYWSDRRFSEEVISSMNEAVDELKSQAHAKEIVLVGFSGGAAVAVLIAARRDDVSEIITVAGNLDHAAINEHHKVAQMKGSLNPIYHAKDISHIPQRHFAGQKDKVVPVHIIKSFAYASGDTDYSTVIIVEECSHNDGWVDIWQEIIE